MSKLRPRQLVMLRGRLWVSPIGDVHDLQCVARTKKGRRCQNPIEYGQVLGFDEFQLGSAGYVRAYSCPGGGETVDAERWLAQHCTLHDTPDVVDCGTVELRRFDIVRDGSHVNVHAYGVRSAELPRELNTMGSEDKTTRSIVAVFAAAARLRPWPGYVNGFDYTDWYVEAGPTLLLALAQLARTHDVHELADRLEQLSKPLCMEPLDAVLSYDTLPEVWCERSARAKGLPCDLHVPERAAQLGRCTWARHGTKRICRSAPLEGDDRCENHAVYCRAVKKDGSICDRPHCRVPKHRQAPGSGAVVRLATAQQ